MKKPALLCLCAFVFTCAIAQMTAAELGQLNELNFIRTQPKSYAEFLRNLIRTKRMDTTSYKIIANELIPMFDTIKPLNPLTANQLLRKAADNFSGFDASKSSMHHDISYFSQVPNLAGGQNLVMSILLKPAEDILKLMVDKCWPERGHRFNFINPDYTEASVRIVKLRGEEQKPYSFLYVVVFDLITNEKGSGWKEPFFRGITTPNCNMLSIPLTSSSKNK